jgi:peptide/nickel transport system substrate-binding protein
MSKCTRAPQVLLAVGLTGLSLVIGLLPTAPAWLGQRSASAASDQTLTFAIDADQGTMDPQTTISATDAVPQLNLYEGLTRFKPDTTNIEPALATDWRASSDGLTWIFNLRKGVKFHDGSAFNAQAVKFSLDRTKTINQGMAFVLRNVTAVQPIGDYQVAIRLSKPDASFFVGLPSIRIVSPTSFDPHMSDSNATKWAYDHAAGTGPYQLVSWQRGSQLVFRQFDGYWGGWNYPHVNQVVQLTVPEFNTRRLMLQRGDIDFMIRIEDYPTAVPGLRSSAGVAIKVFPTLGQTYIAMDTGKAPLRDVRVRQAIAYAIDYDAIQFLAYGLQAKRAVGPLPSTIPYFDKTLVPVKHDVAKAKQLLTDAGYPNGGFTLQYGYIGTVDSQRRVVEIIQQDLAALGIQVQPRPMTSPVLLATFTKPNTTLDLVNVNIYSPYPDPDFVFSEVFATAAQGSAGLNASWYSNPEVDRLIAQGATSTLPTQRKQIYTRLQQIIVADAPMIWNAQLVFLIAARDYVKGFEYLPAFTRAPGYLNHIYLAK